MVLRVLAGAWAGAGSLSRRLAGEASFNRPRVCILARFLAMLSARCWAKTSLPELPWAWCSSSVEVSDLRFTILKAVFLCSHRCYFRLYQPPDQHLPPRLQCPDRRAAHCCQQLAGNFVFGPSTIHRDLLWQRQDRGQFTNAAIGGRSSLCGGLHTCGTAQTAAERQGVRITDSATSKTRH